MDKLQQLYDLYLSNGLISEAIDLNTFSESTPEQIQKLYDELFYQSKYLLKKKGTLAMLLNHEDIVLEVAKKHKFTHVETKKLFFSVGPISGNISVSELRQPGIPF